MKSWEFLRLLSISFPPTDHKPSEITNLIPGAICVALRMARDHWTEVEDKKYYPVFKGKILELAEMLEDEPAEAFGPISV